MSAELVVATPLLIFLVMLIVQFGLWSHATHVAQTAAARGLAAARVYDGTASDGTTAAKNTLANLGNGPLHTPQITTARTADTASVQIHGTASTVVPFLELPVNVTATGPVERFVPASPRGAAP